MVQSTLKDGATPLHVAIIMDGNGRWATRHGLSRSFGHRAGARAIPGVVRAAPNCGIGTLSLFAFSADNWGRPCAEVDELLALFQHFLEGEAARCRAEGVRLSIIGRRDRLPSSLCRAIHAAEQQSVDGRALHLRIAIDYSSRGSILEAARSYSGASVPTSASFAAALARADHSGAPLTAVDLLIRTGGEHRLSDFLLWESAYAELLFLPIAWPDFTDKDLTEAVAEFTRRERRFGALPPFGGTPPRIPGAQGAACRSI